MTSYYRFFICLCSSFIFTSVCAQYRSWDGTGISPFKNYRCLNLYIDIIYDVTDDPESRNSFWKPGVEEGVNKNIPPFAGKYLLPVTINIQKYPGSLSKRYNEASFGHFNLLGEAVSVTIRQSVISENGQFSWRQGLQRAVLLLNAQGGLTGNTINGRDKLKDFTKDGDNRIDIVNIMFRNSSKISGNLPSGGMSGGLLNLGLLINGVKTNANSYTVQLLGSDDVMSGNSTILDHELGHKLLGGNEFHASGGNHWGTYSVCTFMGIQSGYGIMGGGGSNLVCTNAYERWRLHWTSPKYNPKGLLIQASGIPSDIKQTDGEMTFYLRDFITTGDAIRIQLPYKDGEHASNQYLWIENHQIGRNGKEDYYMFAHLDCKDAGIPGIFMYIQVGKDVLESDIRSNVWPSNETDNLKMLSAEGNYDFEYAGMGTDCMHWGTKNRKIFKYQRPNPLAGQNDLTASFITTTKNQLSNKLESGVWIKQLQNKEIEEGWPRHGENNDIFQSGTVLNLSSNPVPTNSVTNYVRQGGGKIREIETNRNTQNIYLTGLRIELTEDDLSEFGDSCSVYKVHIRWDDYNVNNNTRWTGAIVVKEKVILNKKVTLNLDQSKVPTQALRDSISHEFAPPSKFRIDKGGVLHLQKKSSLILEDYSTFRMDSGAVLQLDRKANLRIKSGSTFIVSEGAKLNIHRRADIEIEEGANVYISNDKWDKLNTIKDSSTIDKFYNQ